MELQFNIFGSESSQDFDVMVFMDMNDIPSTINERSILCEEINKLLSIRLNTKKVNSNICVVNDGVIVYVHKGTSDEVNNSIYLTYSLHKQYHPLMVKRMVMRDVDLKLMRGVRIVLSFLSRTKYRSEIKSGLKGDFIQKVDALNIVKFAELPDFGKKNTPMEDAYKVIAFQFGQVLGLFNGKEYYSKESIAGEYPDLKPFLMRETELDIMVLDRYKDVLIAKSYERIPNMKTLSEYDL